MKSLELIKIGNHNCEELGIQFSRGMKYVFVWETLYLTSNQPT